MGVRSIGLTSSIEMLDQEPQRLLWEDIVITSDPADSTVSLDQEGLGLVGAAGPGDRLREGAGGPVLILQEGSFRQRQSRATSWLPRLASLGSECSPIGAVTPHAEVMPQQRHG